MKAARPIKSPLYVLPHGIEVVGEHRSGRFIYCRIRPHPFFATHMVQSRHIQVQRSRVVMSSVLGRALQREEYIGHGAAGTLDDSPGNLVLSTPGEHNRRYKLGTHHAHESKSRIAASLKRAYAEGRRQRPTIVARDEKGRILRCSNDTRI